MLRASGQSSSPLMRAESPRPPRPQLNLDAWSRDLLGQTQLDSIAAVSALVESSQKRGPQGDDPVRDEEQGLIDQQQHDHQHAQYNTSVKAAPQASLPSAPITSSSALLPWLESIAIEDRNRASTSASPAPSTSASSSSNAQASSFASISAACARMTALLDQLESARVNVAELKAGSRAIEETSDELREESERRGDRSDTLALLSDELDACLAYYAVLPAATSFLSSPNLSSVVLNQRFATTLDECDEGLTFVRQHPHFRDAAIYRLRFEHCLTRGGNLARIWVCGKFKELGADGQTRLKERERNLKSRQTTASLTGLADVLLDFASPDLLGAIYPRFVAAGRELREVLGQIRKRCPRGISDQSAPRQTQPKDEASMLADYTTDMADEPQTKINTFPEFETLLADCKSTWFETRRSLLQGLIAASLSRLEGIVSQQMKAADAPSQPLQTSPLVPFLNRALALLKAVLISEAILYEHVFGQEEVPSEENNSISLVDYLRSLAKDLLDRMHPRTYAETRVTTLSRLARCLLESVIADTATPPHLLFSPSDPYDFSRPPQHFELDRQRTVFALLQPLVLPLYTDTMARLLYRSRAVLHGRDVAGYVGSLPELTALMANVTRSKRAEMLGLNIDAEGQDDGREEGSLKPGKRRKGRSSLGAGVLQAAAERAVAEREAEAESEASSGANKAGTHTSIELFAPPEATVLSTWHPALVRSFQVLAALHPVLERSEFAKFGVEAIECARTSIQRSIETLTKGKAAGQPDALDVALFRLRHALLLREMSASVDLSLLQTSRADAMQQTVREARRRQHTQGEDGGDRGDAQQQSDVLDAGVVMKVVSGLLDAVKVFGGSGSGSSSTTSNSSQATAPTSASVLVQDVTQASTVVVEAALSSQSLAAVIKEQQNAPTARIVETLLPTLRRLRRRILLWVEDDMLASGVVEALLNGLQGRLGDGAKDVVPAVAERMGIFSGADAVPAES
ncbi:unnamed protein product [Jaminaea pallidilutea]